MMQPRGYSAVCQLLPISATPSLHTNCMQKQCLREFEVPVNFEQQPGLTLFQPPCSHTSHHNTSHLCNMLSGSPCHFTSLYTSLIHLHLQCFYSQAEITFLVPKQTSVMIFIVSGGTVWEFSKPHLLPTHLHTSNSRSAQHTLACHRYLAHDATSQQPLSTTNKHHLH